MVVINFGNITHLGNSTITIERNESPPGYCTTIFVSDKDIIECQNTDWSRQVDEAFARFQQDLCDILGIE